MEEVNFKNQTSRRVTTIILGVIIAVSLLLPFLSSIGSDAQIIAPGQDRITNEINQKELS